MDTEDATSAIFERYVIEEPDQHRGPRILIPAAALLLAVWPRDDERFRRDHRTIDHFVIPPSREAETRAALAVLFSSSIYQYCVCDMMRNAFGHDPLEDYDEVPPIVLKGASEPDVSTCPTL